MSTGWYSPGGPGSYYVPFGSGGGQGDPFAIPQFSGQGDGNAWSVTPFWESSAPSGGVQGYANLLNGYTEQAFDVYNGFQPGSSYATTDFSAPFWAGEPPAGASDAPAWQSYAGSLDTLTGQAFDIYNTVPRPAVPTDGQPLVPPPGGSFYDPGNTTFMGGAFDVYNSALVDAPAESAPPDETVAEEAQPPIDTSGDLYDDAFNAYDYGMNPPPPAYTGPTTSAAGEVHVRGFENLMRLYSPDGEYSAEELRAAALANESNPDLMYTLLRMADIAEAHQRPITQQELVQLASGDEYFSAQDILNLPSVAGWGAPTSTGAPGAFDYLEIIRQMEQYDNGDGIYSPEELRVAAQNETDPARQFMYYFLADISESYGIAITPESLQMTANRSGNDRFFTISDIGLIPRQANAALQVQGDHDDYVDYVLLITILSQFDANGDGVYSEDEMRQALDAVRSGAVSFPEGVSRDLYIKGLEQLINLTHDEGLGAIDPWRLRRAAQAGANDRWIGLGWDGVFSHLNGSEINKGNLGY